MLSREEVAAVSEIVVRETSLSMQHFNKDLKGMRE
jgi:hypothetical protein